MIVAAARLLGSVKSWFVRSNEFKLSTELEKYLASVAEARLVPEGHMRVMAASDDCSEDAEEHWELVRKSDFNSETEPGQVLSEHPMPRPCV